MLCPPAAVFTVLMAVIDEVVSTNDAKAGCVCGCTTAQIPLPLRYMIAWLLPAGGRPGPSVLLQGRCLQQLRWKGGGEQMKDRASNCIETPTDAPIHVRFIACYQCSHNIYYVPHSSTCNMLCWRSYDSLPETSACHPYACIRLQGSTPPRKQLQMHNRSCTFSRLSLTLIAVWRRRPERPVLPRRGANGQRLRAHVRGVPHLRLRDHHPPGGEAVLSPQLHGNSSGGHAAGLREAEVLRAVWLQLMSA
jgi:hypothetical protein